MNNEMKCFSVVLIKKQIYFDLVIHGKTCIRMQWCIKGQKNIVWSFFVEFRVKICCFGYEFDYGYEYHGPSHSMVCTPFTDRCVYAILMALHQYQVGSLFGSVGYGKSALCSEISKVGK